jgi:2-methylcitrate dehydratase PrpD
LHFKPNLRDYPKVKSMNDQNRLTLSALVAAHAAQCRFESLPRATVAAAKRAILDGTGVMFAASGMSSDVVPFVELARTQAASPQATIIGFKERVSVPMAALANGAMAHALDFEDAFDPAPCHPNASLLPALLSVAEFRSPISGREFIAAVAAGCDLVCRMALSLRQPMEAGGWYPPPILGAFGATAAVSRALRLTSAQVTDAFSLLLCQNTCPGEIKHSPETVIRAVREAFPAQAAVLSALLAERGVRGFAHPLEGQNGFFALYASGRYEPSDITDRLGERFWIDDLSFKKWPCCRGTHAYIEAAQTLRRAHGFSPADIAGVRILGGELQRMLCEPRAQKQQPQTVIDAKFSLPFTIAVALRDEEVTLNSFTPAALTNPVLLALAAGANFEFSQEISQAAAGEIRVTLKDGTVLGHSVRHALGDPTRPLNDASLRAKFVDCTMNAALPLTRPDAEALADRIMNLEREPDVGALLR